MANKDWTDYEIPENHMTTLEVNDLAVNNEISAGEFIGKNACTAWVNFDGTTTPPTIRDSYNVSSVVRTATGNYDVYFEESMDNVNYSVSGSAGRNEGFHNNTSTTNTTSKFSVFTYRDYDGANSNTSMMCINVKGGKN